MAATPTQDLPPKGGYAPINFIRIPARSYFNGYQLFAGFGAVSAVAFYLYYKTYSMVRREDIEMRSGLLAIEPMLLAERDREFLKQIRRNRDEEAKLMANVEGWEVGTYRGEPIYKTVSKERFLDPVINEYFAHGHTKAYSDNAFFSLFT
ncbi:NADH dehydrogenase [ubiquinone] 1 alpha subcomplex subunit 13-like [Portunus trituberculatus]|uniref:NADH dehydrogenase [ubiquinone] 1 alpha subcomplex subunit 13-like n=1 Tax=Portunus trituberculatus TaxID=210409 RepID=UPI001E1CB683|nr:NADH dehydrogenase [ubiquinone] 1 alpha subcomplex subunit 13-like [Portunus trituberculatus]